MGDNALIPGRIARSRTVVATSWFVLFMFGAFIGNTYFIPIYFQAVLGASAQDSGIRMIPLLAVNVATLIIVGVISSKTGHYVPFFPACAIVTALGCGLITTWQLDSPAGIWVGYQIILGIGIGLALQLPAVAVQAVRTSFVLFLFVDINFSSQADCFPFVPCPVDRSWARHFHGHHHRAYVSISRLGRLH